MATDGILETLATKYPQVLIVKLDIFGNRNIGKKTDFFWQEARLQNWADVELPWHLITDSILDPPANGQAVIFLTGLLEVFISEI